MYLAFRKLWAAVFSAKRSRIHIHIFLHGTGQTGEACQTHLGYHRMPDRYRKLQTACRESAQGLPGSGYPRHHTAFHIEPEELAQNDIDLIISTVRLDTAYRYIYVSPLLNRQDRMLLDSKFQLILSQKSDRRPHAEKKVPKTSFTRKDIHFVSRTGAEIEYLLDHIRIGRAPVLQERQEILAYAASLFSDTPEMESHFYEILKKRDQIADTYMKPFHALLLHGKSPDIMHPCFGYVHLEPPIYENARIILGAIVTFIPENDPDQVSAPIVSEIIGSLMEQPELLKALREDDDERFTLLLETSLMKFYKETAADRLKLSAQDK